MKELTRLFAEKKTENGDKAYKTTGSNMTDILFMSQYYRNHLDEVPSIKNYENGKLFAMFMRDPRFGLGERDLGRKLLKQVYATPLEIVKCGRFDDLFYTNVGIKSEENPVMFILNEAKKGNKLAKKWLPRLNSGNDARIVARQLCKIMGISQKEYRKLIKVDTTESELSDHKMNEIEYEKVPSLAMLKYWKAFKSKDTERFNEYLESVKKGDAKMNASVTNCYDVYKQFKNDNKDCQLLFEQLNKANVGSILPIVDHSGSMFNSTDSVGKAMSIGHYVAKNSDYMHNHIITFSRNPHLLELGKTYDEDMYVFNSYNDVSSTNLSAVMDLLSGLKEDFPGFLLVLSDMEFDMGSSTSKEKTMKIFKERGAKTKIIWWNFNTRNTTSPEIDEHGNIYLSGYSPQLLAMLEVGFNQDLFLSRLLDEYAKKIDY